MRHQFRCRRCEARSRSFVVAGSKPHYAPDLPFRIQHILLDVNVDPVGGRLRGVVTHRVRTVASGQKQIRLDQVGLSILDAKVEGKAARFTVEGHALLIELARAPKPGQEFEFTVRYEVSRPRRGLYFTGPDADYPKKPYQVWSQGQDEDSRYWFPTFDYPNQKATSEMIATVPKGYTAVSNGALLSRKEVGAKQTRFHYKLGSPHVNYLITLVVAKLSEWADAGPGGLPVQYFVEPGREADGRRAFGNTPRMIEVFEKKTGVKYPYEKYAQVAVQDFIFGGMENTSATTETDRILHDERAHLDFSADPLVSHELAHQWFGDLLTCRDWSHGWLNEGFATFLERVWIENKPGAGGGLEEAKYYSAQDLKEYLAEDSGKYRRPIVCNTYIEPIDLFDTHLYQKGGLVLNLIRSILGEEDFWRSVRVYVERHRGGSVETLDLIRAIEEVTGRNLRRFFDQWVFGAGFPEFEASYSWHADKKLAELVIEQKQQGCGVFHLPLVIELGLEGGRTLRHTIDLAEARERVFIPAPSKPVRVRLDPGNAIPKTLKFPRPKELLLEQLARDPDCMGRIEAARELIAGADAETVAALGRAATRDPFWGVQVEAASALAEIRSDAARDCLIDAMKVKHPKARRGIVSALGTYRDAKAAAALRKLAEKDPSYFVQAEATSAFAHAQSRPDAGSAEAGELEKFLIAQASKTESFLDVIRAAAIRSMAELPGIGRGERPRALEALRQWTRRGSSIDARVAAITALGRIAQSAAAVERALILETLSWVAEEDHFRLRTALVPALRSTTLPGAIPILEKIRTLDSDGRVKREAMLAADALRASGSVPETVGALREALTKLELEHRKLRSALEEKQAGRKARV